MTDTEERIVQLIKKADREQSIVEELPPGWWPKMFRLLHHLIVMFDDLLCDEFGLSRQAKGKWLEHR